MHFLAALTIYLAAATGSGTTTTATDAPASAAQVGPLIARTSLALVGVNVIPMDRERVLENQTVHIVNGVIAAIGPASTVQISGDVQRIDARGKYLIPGFVDMHAHSQPGEGLPNDPAGRQMIMYLAHGITGMRTLAGPSYLAMRERVASGQVLGPRIVAYSSPSLNPNTIASAGVAGALVADFRRQGYDGVKTHGGHTAEIYDSITAAIRREGIPLAGHVTPGYGLSRAIAAGQQIEHLDGFFQALLPASYSGAPLNQLVFDPQVLASLDTTRIPAIARQMAAARVWNGPTLALFRTIAGDSTPEQMLARQVMKYVPPAGRQQWAAQLGQQQANAGPPEGRRRFIALRDQIVRELHKGGVKLLSSSDSPQFFMVAGDALIREIEALTEAGIPAYAALEAATRNPAEFLGRSDILGTVSVGKRADLVLLDANPLADIHNIRRVQGVIADGRWLDRARLDAMLAGVAAQMGG